jgi:hypothetical protein
MDWGLLDSAHANSDRNRAQNTLGRHRNGSWKRLALPVGSKVIRRVNRAENASNEKFLVSRWNYLQVVEIIQKLLKRLMPVLG